jgi:hypothetical protein
MSAWISVKERLPGPDQRILAHMIDGYIAITHYNLLDTDGDLMGFFFINSKYASIQTSIITHWQPLPAPPMGDK